MPLKRINRKGYYRYSCKLPAQNKQIDWRPDLGHLWLSNRLSQVVFALIFTVVCCTQSKSFAQQSEDRGGFSARPNDALERSGGVTTSSSRREAGSEIVTVRAEGGGNKNGRPHQDEPETKIEERAVPITAKLQLSWKPEWPRHGLREYLAIPILGITALVLKTQVENPDEARVRGGFLLDGPMRDLLRLENRDDRLLASTFSDFGFYGLQLYPLVIDVLVVSLLVDELPDLALELTIMTLQALAISHVLVNVSQKLVGRERPFSERCEAENYQNDPECRGSDRYTSFFSGHTLGAFTGAGVICAQHQMLDLYGGGAIEEVVCGSALALASLTGVLRVMSDRHWFTDVLTSTAIGLASGWLMPYLLHFHFDNSNTQNSAFNSGTIIPLLDDEVYGIGYFSVF